MHVADVLWQQPQLATAVAQEAQQAQAATPAATVTPKQTTTTLDLQAAVKSAETLPVGWQAGFPSSKKMWALTVLGWVLTIGAISFGAPFWFDLLTRMNSLRATGPPAT
jgi:hypothetical protein